MNKRTTQSRGFHNSFLIELRIIIVTYSVTTCDDEPLIVCIANVWYIRIFLVQSCDNCSEYNQTNNSRNLKKEKSS